MTLPSSASPVTDSFRNSFWSLLDDRRRILGKLAECPAECHQDLSGVVQVEEIDGRRVLPFEEADLQVPHEPGRRHPEIIPHHHDGLEMLAIALTKGGDQFGVLLTPLGMRAIARTGPGPAAPCALAARRDLFASSPANRPAPILAAVQDRPCANP